MRRYDCTVVRDGSIRGERGQEMRAEVNPLKRGESTGRPAAVMQVEEFSKVDDVQGGICQPDSPC